MFRYIRNFFRGYDGQAFPGDTYLPDVYAVAKTGKSWARWLIFAVFLGFVADLYFLQDTVAVAFDENDVFHLALCWITAAALVFLYLFIGHVGGKKLRDYRVFQATSSLVATFVAFAILICALVALTFFRLSAELGDTSVGQVISSFFFYLSSNDEEHVAVVSKVFVMTLVMLLSAFISALHAYYSGDAVSEVVYRESVACLPADKALYNKVFFAHSNDVEKERAYESQERELDKQAVESAFKLGSIASQLNGMVDPADAHEFLEAQRAIAADYFNRGA